MTHIDHIDPSWEEGRDYQLVCGLDSPLNFKERDPSFNITKSNRFLPWRVSEGEIGVSPIEEGDLCLFLDPDSGEWVLEEFLGSWWMSKSQKTCGPSAGKVGKKRPDVSARNRLNNPSKGRKLTQAHKDNLSKALTGKPKPEEAKANMRKPKNLSPEQRAQRSALSTAVAATTKRNDQGQFTK
jgi:hypothetical protein